MPHGVTFDELLQQKLSPPPIDSRPAGTHGPAGMGAAYGFFFVEGSRSSGSLTWASRAGLSAAAGGGGRRGQHPSSSIAPDGGRTHLNTTATDRLDEAFSSPTTGSRPVTTLSPREQQAVDTLAALGARLSPSFTPIELRSAFRQLARRYHPDRHPGIADAEKSRLAGSFALAREAYRVLAERFRRSH